MVNFTAIENLNMKKIVNLIVLLFLLAACEDVFNPPPKAFLNATLRYTDNDKNELIKNIEVSVTGVAMEEPWIEQDTTRSILIPLNDTPATDYIFVLNGVTDTIQIIADSKLIYESMETGFYPEFKILDILYTTRRIDFIEVKDSAVTKEWNENIIININTDIFINN
ncbi:MAG: hypothetical protein A2W90_11170 [Bacteroidetes bacterium GWF2_42_66]|nr:MAG: hypothetical protein A2W92_10160 [Bacteroidetes bacterium GWA2_42_15]OFY01863.1 MAG: hypothetical protein A2W89_23400 [Bacteroidetes bacterium GWE2_42_39]OFY44842.1 MAG: hypothetical protein A2W90_11170 [Bacteroidetes bacterium GWF2_42_66]HBL75969.1 hypothetical protein [Prolixibacteraceae bacterium]HCR89776.1 hypothetical protein [Prolixibacteraceae bacterium]